MQYEILTYRHFHFVLLRFLIKCFNVLTSKFYVEILALYSIQQDMKGTQAILCSGRSGVDYNPLNPFVTMNAPRKEIRGHEMFTNCLFCEGNFVLQILKSQMQKNICHSNQNDTYQLPTKTWQVNTHIPFCHLPHRSRFQSRLTPILIMRTKALPSSPCLISLFFYLSTSYSSASLPEALFSFPVFLTSCESTSCNCRYNICLEGGLKVK